MLMHTLRLRYRTDKLLRLLHQVIKVAVCVGITGEDHGLALCDHRLKRGTIIGGEFGDNLA